MSEYITEHYYDGESMAIRQAQREEIVRCRDCEHYDETEVRTWEFERRKMPTCGRFASFLHGTQPDGYCAWGERKVDR